MNYLIKFAQVHEDFRLAEIEAVAASLGISLAVQDYSSEAGIFTRAIRLVSLTHEIVTHLYRIAAMCRRC